MSSEEMIGSTFKCPNCGAALEASPDALVYVCAHCGWAGYDKGTVVFFGMEPAPETELVKAILTFLSRKIKGEIKIREVVTVMLPFWAVGLRARTSYNGYRTEVRGSGKQREVIYFPLRDELDETVLVPVYARAFESFFGLEEIKSRVVENFSLAAGIDPISLIKLVRILNVEKSEEEAIDYAKSKVSDDHRKRVEALANKVFDCYTKFEVLSKELVYYPVALIKYEHKGKLYRVCSDASISCETEDRVLKVELPLTALTRLYYALASDLAVLAFALALTPINYVLESGWSKDNNLAPLIVIILAVSGFIGWRGVNLATKEERVWRINIGEDRLMDLDELKKAAEKASRFR